MNQKTSEQIRLTSFQIGSAVCGIDILEIQEINKADAVTRVPHAPAYIQGILNLRGRIVTIMDLAGKLGLGAVSQSRHNRTIIVAAGEEFIGLSVDRIEDVVMAGNGDIEPVPSNIGRISGRYFQGAVKNKSRLIGILNLEAVLNA